jgi:hypothetical protein
VQGIVLETGLFLGWPSGRDWPLHLGLRGIFMHILQDVTGRGSNGSPRFGAVRKSGTTTLDKGFREVLCFPETQTMAQRNGFEMEEP